MMHTMSIPINLPLLPKTMSATSGTRRNRYFVDSFQSPLDLPQAQTRSGHRPQNESVSPLSRSPGSLAKEFTDQLEVSASHVPDSFHSYSIETRGRNPSARSPHSNVSMSEESNTSSGPARIIASPVLTFRRVGSFGSLSKPLEDVSLGGDPPIMPRRHRRKSSGSFDMTGEMSSSPEDVSSPLAINFALPIDNTRYDEFGEECARHHHRESTDSIVSIRCGRTEEDDDDGSCSSTTDYVEGDVEAAIVMEAADTNYLVPLVDRAQEMKELLAHPSNADWARCAERALGSNAWRTECIPLWCEVNRDKMSDLQWLKRSKDLLCRHTGKDYLWGEFCQIVGWDEDDFPPEISSIVNHLRSHESLRSVSNMNSITEEEEEEEDPAAI